jgi:prepilin-type N-terminal cleavage/methylation domain-containing protein
LEREYVRRVSYSKHTETEGGFTLVEVLISIVILTMIAGALSAAFVTATRASATNAQLVHSSNDAQLIAASLVRDAQAAGGSNPSTGQIDPTLGVSHNWVGENAGSDPDASACRDADPAHQLVVRFAWADRLDSTTAHIHIAKYYFAPATLQAPGQLVRVTCIDNAADTTQTLGYKLGSIPTVTCTPAASCPGIPNLVSMTITEVANPANPSNPYTYTLNASLRPSSDVPVLTSGGSATVPLLALGGGTCSGGTPASGFADGGSSNLKVYGGVLVSAPGTPRCPATDFFGNAYTYTAAGLPQQGVVADPYASLLPPAGTCPAGGGTNPAPVGGRYQPGVYPQPLPNDAVLAPGIFILCASPGSGLTGTGVMLYLAQGTINWSGGNTNLTAASSGPYAGIAIWQPSSNTSTITIQGNAGLTLGTASPSVSPPMGSGIYAPSAEVDLSGTADLFLGWVIAKTILITGDHAVTVGVPPATLPQITGPASLPTGVVGTPYPNTQVVAGGGAGGNTWSVTGPSWMSIDSNGVLSGTPNAALTNGSVTVTVTDNLGDVSQATYALTVDALPTVTSTSPSSGSQGATNRTIGINGSGFINGATVAFSGAGITVNSTAWASSTRINVNIDIASNAATGSRGITVTNLDGGTVTGTGVFAVSAPAAIASVTLANGGATPGTIEKGDTITVVFSAQMSVASLCPTWSGDAANQALSSNNDVTVTVSDGIGASHDAMTVTSGSCTSGFNFGSVDLGSNAYVSGGGAIFTGKNGNKSTIAWTAASHTLVITLGAMTSGTVANVVSSTPVYAASPSIADSGGAGLTNSPFTLAAAKQF